MGWEILSLELSLIYILPNFQADVQGRLDGFFVCVVLFNYLSSGILIHYWDAWKVDIPTADGDFSGFFARDM